MTEILNDADADIGRLEGRTIAEVGYVNQGRAQALNMRGSGLENIVIGNVRDEGWKTAESDGFSLVPKAEAVKEADIIFMLVPDEVTPNAYREHVEPYLGSGKTLDFASGYTSPSVTSGHSKRWTSSWWRPA